MPSGALVTVPNEEAVIAVVKLCAMKGTINQDILALFEMRSGRKESGRNQNNGSTNMHQKDNFAAS